MDNSSQTVTRQHDTVLHITNAHIKVMLQWIVSIMKKKDNYARGHEQNVHTFSNRINYDYGSTKQNT